jgi:hypothetical protein
MVGIIPITIVSSFSVMFMKNIEKTVTISALQVFYLVLVKELVFCILKLL